jgi:hypothetical protein
VHGHREDDADDDADQRDEIADDPYLKLKICTA